MSLFVKFNQIESDVWAVVDTFNPGDIQVAVIQWHEDWERFVLCPLPKTIWEAEVLEDVQKFLNLETKRRLALGT